MNILLTRAQFEAMETGVGWEELMVESEDGSEVETQVERIAWAGENVAFAQSGHAAKKSLLADYGKRWNSRVWLGPSAPTRAEMEAAPWD